MLRRLLILPFVVCPVLAGGCNIAGPFVAVMAGPEGYKARYVLPKEQVAVVFVDDRTNVAPTRSVRELVGLTAERALLKSGVVKDMVQSRLVLSTLRSERMGEPMTIAQVGRSVQARVVIYATLDSWSLSPDGQTFSPKADLRVKVVDAETSARLWPGGDEQADGYAQLSVAVPPQSRAAPTTTAATAEAHLELARWVGLRLAQMFYDHGPEEVPEKFNTKDRGRE